MKIEAAPLIEDVKIIEPVRRADARGLFCEVFRRDLLVEAGICEDWVQDNTSISTQRGTIRGLHFQSPPFAQAKLVRVTRGRILDVAVDLRQSSRTFGRHVVVELSAENWRQMYIPTGFAHGFCCLEAGTEIQYKVSARYSPAHDLGVAWNDPDLAIDWRISATEAVLSEKDLRQPDFRSLPAFFP